MDERSYVKDLRKTPKKLELVRMRGLEPPHLAAPEPKSGVSTNSTTPAQNDLTHRDTSHVQSPSAWLPDASLYVNNTY